MKTTLAVLAALAVAGYRATIEPTLPLQTQDIFKDVAHLFVGGCFGAGLAGKKAGWILGGALTAFEVACFFVGKNTGHSVLSLFQ